VKTQRYDELNPAVTSSETTPSVRRIHVLCTGPAGLLLTGLLQSGDRYSVQLYEKRRDYTRTRMV